MGSWLSACALLLGGGEGDVAAPPPVAPPALAAELTAALPADERFSWGLLVRFFYTQSPGEANDVDEDVSGFVWEDADVHLAYDQGDVAWRVSADVDGNGGDRVDLEEAWVRWEHLDWLALGAGQFRPRVMRSGSLPEEGLLFRERSFIGAAFDLFDDGVELGGHYDQFDYWFALTDGANVAQSGHLYSTRLEWALYDEGWWDAEGARGAPNHLRALLGATWFRDDSLSSSDGGGYGGDLAITFGPYSFLGEWTDLDESFARTIDVFNGYLITLGDGKPFGATFGRRLGENAEAAVRFQDADDADSTEAFGFGASWCPGGSAARFVADVALVEGDSRDFSLFSIGVVLGSSGRGAGGTR